MAFSGTATLYAGCGQAAVGDTDSDWGAALDRNNVPLIDLTVELKVFQATAFQNQVVGGDRVGK